MSKVLYIKANPKTDEESRTFRIANSFVNEYYKMHPDDEVITLDLYKEGIQFLPAEELAALRAPITGEKKEHPILKYAYQFYEADKFILAAPFWNLSIPAILKAYIDYITIAGITFQYTVDGAEGLCSGKKAVHITSRGGNYTEDPLASYEMGDRYLRTLFGFLGITDFVTISAEGLDMVGNDVEGILGDAVMRAQNYAHSF